MAAAAERTDELVREYLLFRGFTAALKQLDAEIKADREKGFRVSGGRDPLPGRALSAGTPPGEDAVPGQAAGAPPRPRDWARGTGRPAAGQLSEFPLFPGEAACLRGGHPRPARAGLDAGAGPAAQAGPPVSCDGWVRLPVLPLPMYAQPPGGGALAL